MLSVGLLGVAGAQLVTLRNNHSAWLRSQATVCAYDILERMRANREQALDGDYDIGLGDPAPDGDTPRDLDLQEWRQALAALPDGDGAVARTVSGDQTLFTVTVQWDDSRGAQAPQQFVTAGEL